MTCTHEEYRIVFETYIGLPQYFLKCTKCGKPITFDQALDSTERKVKK